MIALWMGYALVVGVLGCVAGIAAERIVGFWNGPRRGIWIAAVALTVLVPIAPPARRTAPRRSDVVRAKMERAIARARIRPSAPPPRELLRARLYEIANRYDHSARRVWAFGSGLMAVAFLIAVLRVRRERLRWVEARLNGHRVLVTEDVGPALVGFLDPRIVIPRWALGLEAAERRFMLHHELEHLGAEDPRLLLLAGLLLVVFPWNVALWWMTQRLRLAIEIDCDTRVVQTCGAPREYGLFLLAVGERRTRALPLAASLAERRSLLEKRIRAMTTQRPRYPLLASIPLAAICLGAATLVAQTPPPAGEVVIARSSPKAAPPDRIQLSPDQVRAIVASRYPTIAAGTSNENMLTVVISSAGDLIATGVTELRPTAVRVNLLTDSTDRALVERKLAITKANGAFGEVAIPADSAGNAEAERAIALKKALLERAGVAMRSVEGLGGIDPALIHDMYMMSFDAGEVSANRLNVRVVTLGPSPQK